MPTYALVLGAVLAVACVLFVARPFLREPLARDDALGEPGALDRRRLELEEPIRSLGVHEVAVRLHTDVTAQVTVEVVADTA